MQWLTDQDLRNWAKRTDARELFVDMVGDLIRATVSDITKFRFPGQSAGTLRGFDGDLEVDTNAAATRVPLGASVWEFGTNSACKAKANDDYKKRTDKMPVEVMKANAFVMLNLHNWDAPRDQLTIWQAEKNAEGKWREVHFLDGTVLQKWLEEKPAVAARYARNVLNKAPHNGALSTDEFWEFFSNDFKPKLTEDMLLAGRADESKQLLEVLTGGPQNFTIAAENAEEVIAFAVAAIRKAPEATRRLLEAKTMIVDTYEAAQFLSGMLDMVYLVWRKAEPLAATLGKRGPTLTAATGVVRKGKAIPQLNRPTASAWAEAMATMNIEQQAAYEMAHKCGRSLVILRRQNSASGTYPPAEWVDQAEALKPALLAGGWTSNSELDKEVVASLGGSDYLSVERPVRATLGISDPPFDTVDNVWQVRAAVDAFPYYGHLVDEEDLVRLKAAVVKVLGHQVARPSAEERFSLEYRAPADYSSWLRDGLAQTLNLFAVLPELGGLKLTGTTPQRYVDDVVRSLPDYAKSHRWILPILDQLSTMAEAAPIPFLEALEKSLEGANDDALKLFQESDGNDILFRQTSPHVYVLWALEVIAWDPVHLSRSVIALAKLARIDPNANSKNGNRPLGSLRGIFLAWAPNTDADLNKRIKALDVLIRELPDVAWDVLIAVAPRVHDIGSPSAKPKLRDTTPMTPEVITFGLVWDTYDRYLERTLSLAKGDDRRMVQLVEHLSSYHPQARERLLKAFEEELSGPSPAEGKQLWHKLHAFVAKHEAYSSADWAVKGEELGRIKYLVTQYKPTDLIAQVRHLFDEWVPHLSENVRTSMEDAEIVRSESLQRIYAALGIEGLLKLARTVKLPAQMGQGFEKLDLPFNEIEALIFSLLDAGGECSNLACGISGVQRRKGPDPWAAYFETHILPKVSTLRDAASLVATWPDSTSTWEFVARQGTQFSDAYWKNFGSLPYHGTEAERSTAIAMLRSVGCSVRVITSLHQRIADIPSQTLLDLLDDAVKEISESGHASSMLSYALGEIFDALSDRNDLPAIDVARREYIYLPLIEDGVKGLAVYKVLASDPSEYVEIIANVYVGKNEVRAASPTEEMRMKAHMSYRLLKAFHTVPGADSDGVIDGGVLKAWVVNVRAIAKERDRTDIVDQYIGQLLAHSKPEPESGHWPQAAVANLLDEIASDVLDHGIEVERFNLRGVHWRGIYDGGRQERALAATYRGWAEQISSPRTTEMLERIARVWDAEAVREDIRAEQEMLKR